MLLAQTSHGVARLEGDRYEIVDVNAGLGDLIRSGRLALATTARTTGNVPVDSVVTHAPIERPGKVCIVGLNYADHAAEIGAEIPRQPRFFWAAGSAVIGPDEPILLPEAAPHEVDYEGELALIIGKRARGVREADAWSHVAGVTAANDVSARDVQLGRRDHLGRANVGVGKSFDTFTPLGPAMSVAGDLDPQQSWTLRTLVDGEVRQQSSTDHLIFGFTALIAEISRYATLEPGDVILTGTPAGVAEYDKRFLAAGQTVDVQVDGIGSLRNPVKSV